MERTTVGAVVGRKALQKREVCRLSQEHLWGIILAGGEGRRPQPFIRAFFGVDRPKQYCALINHHSMLSHTLRRAERLIPPDRLLVIIIEPVEVLGRRQGEAVYQVRQFWEKPTLEKVADLYLQRCLWNTMVLVARATVLLELFQELTPELMDAFEPIAQALGSPREAETMRTAYTQLPPVNFS